MRFSGFGFAAFCSLTALAPACSTTGGDPEDAPTSVGGSSSSGGTSASSSGGTTSSSGGTGGAAADGTGSASGGSNSQTGGSGGMSAGCTPLPAGNLVTNGELIFDETTCLTWMKTNATNHPYADAEAYCETLELGGYDDFRLPTAGEAATLFECPLAYPDLLRPGFVAVGDGIWTSTLSGTVAGDQPKVCGAGQSSGAYYDFGKVGGQNTRCVRGESTVPDRTDCKTNTAICSP